MSHLTIHQFIEQNELNVERLYIDKFWSNISQDKWIYVGNEMLKWIGYPSNDHYCELLSSNFIENDDYKTISNLQIREIYVILEHYIDLPAEMISGNYVNHLIVSPDCFKASLMMMDTERAKQISTCYLRLENVFHQYMTTINN